MSEKRKTKGGAKMADARLHPPDKKKFERETADLNRQIKELEVKLKAANTDNTVQSISGELLKLQAELVEAEKMRGTNKAEVKKIEDHLRSLGAEVMKKKNEASSLLAGMRCNSETKIDEMISKLRTQMLTRQLSDSDQRKYRHEIETLEKSRIQLREFTKAKEDADRMRNDQDELRKMRDACYRLSRELKEKETKTKDKMVELKLSLEHAREKKREVSTHKENISKDIDRLYECRRQLAAKFRREQAAYQEERRRIRVEEEKREEEERQAMKEAKFKRKLDQEMYRAIHYDEDIAIARALIAHLQQSSSGLSYPPESVGGDSESPSTSSTNLDAPDHEVTASVGGRRDTTVVDQKPGEFVRKKDTEEVLVPAKWTVVRRKSKREKRKSAVPKRLNFNAAIFDQFSHLGIQPPSSQADIHNVISKLQEKLTFFERKSKATLAVPAYSEAGDSGVGGMTDISQAQSVATSQEDLHLITVSPLNSMTDLKNASPSRTSPAPQNLSDDDSSQTVVEDDDVSTPRSNSSLMAVASS